MNKKIASALGFVLAWNTGTALAATVGEGVTINGFLTAGVTYADSQLLPMSEKSQVVSQDGLLRNEFTYLTDSRFGLQVTANVNPKIAATGQLIAHGHDNFSMSVDWAFLTYKADDNLSVRGGRIKMATSLISDFFEIGYAYPWVRPPMEVYSASPFSTMSRMNGVDLLYRVKMGGLNLLVQPYFGGNQKEEFIIPQNPNALVTLYGHEAGEVEEGEFAAERIRGVNLSLGGDVFTVRAGYLKTKLNIKKAGAFQDNATHANAGATFDWKNIVFYSEYFQRKVDSAANTIFPNQKGSYVTLGYRLGDWLPHLTSGRISDNGNPATLGGLPLKQKSTTLGLRRELGAGAAIKFEAQQIKPEAGTTGLLIRDPNSADAPDRGGSVMVYSLAVDMMF